MLTVDFLLNKKWTMPTSQYPEFKSYALAMHLLHAKSSFFITKYYDLSKARMLELYIMCSGRRFVKILESGLTCESKLFLSTEKIEQLFEFTTHIIDMDILNLEIGKIFSRTKLENKSNLRSCTNVQVNMEASIYFMITLDILVLFYTNPLLRSPEYKGSLENFVFYLVHP